MKRTLLIIIFILGIYFLVACNKSKESEANTDNIKSPTEVINNTVTTEESSVITLTSDEQIYSTKSEDGSIVINVATYEDFLNIGLKKYQLLITVLHKTP